MANIEIHARCRIQDGRLDTFKQHASRIVDAGREAGGVLRCDWFISEERGESVAMTVYRDEDALVAHRGRAEEAWRGVRSACAGGVFEVFGILSDRARVVLAEENPRMFGFVHGLKDGQPQPVVGARKPGGIEIYTRFDIRDGELEAFKARGAELLAVVRDNDPGTLRYDWFYDEAQLQCVVMDTYADAQGMFAHMRNAHDAHEKVLAHASMITEFLGELPAHAAAAVAKYDPFVVKLHAGLRLEPDAEADWADEKAETTS